MRCNFMYIAMREKSKEHPTNSHLGFHVGYDNSKHVLYAKGGEGTFYNGSGPTTMSHDDIEIGDESFNSIRTIFSNDFQRFQLCYRMLRAGFCVGEMPVNNLSMATHLRLYRAIFVGNTRHYENSENLFIAHCKARWTSLPIIFVALEEVSTFKSWRIKSIKYQVVKSSQHSSLLSYWSMSSSAYSPTNEQR